MGTHNYDDCEFTSHELLVSQCPEYSHSHLLVLGPNSIKSLLLATPIAHWQAETLLEIEDAIQFADQQRKKVQGRLVLDPDEVRLILPVAAELGSAASGSVGQC